MRKNVLSHLIIAVLSVSAAFASAEKNYEQAKQDYETSLKLNTEINGIDISLYEETISKILPMIFVEGNSTISNFFIGKFEVTQGLWKSVMGTTVSNQRDKEELRRHEEAMKRYERGNKQGEAPKKTTLSLNGEGDNYPMYYVSWDEAQDFIKRLNASYGTNFRLPTDAEWEYAAKGGNKSAGYQYSGSSKVGDVAWYAINSSLTTKMVGTKQPNELGIYDMSGNVREWCQDIRSGSNRVVRGGSYFGLANFCRVTSKDGDNPESRSSFGGFRLATSFEPKAAVEQSSQPQTVVEQSQPQPKGESVYLLTEMSYDKEVVRYEYDNQDRISKITGYSSAGNVVSVGTFIYNSAGDLTSFERKFSDTPERNINYTFTRNGNIITWNLKGANEYAGVTSLNAEGLPEKTDLPSDRYIITYQYKNGNLSSERAGWIESELAYSIDHTLYDDKKSPFYCCKTPKWFFIFYFNYDIKNNALIYNSYYENSNENTNTYTYNESGFPLTRKSTIKIRDGEGNEIEEKRTETTFKYEKR